MSCCQGFQKGKKSPADDQVAGKAAGIALGGRDKVKLHSMKPGKLHQLFQFPSSLHIPKDLIVPKESR